MNRIPVEDRREILRRKLRGATNQEVADSLNVSKGFVAKVLDEARSGEVTAFEDLEDQVDALLSLGKRLDEADLDVTAAHAGLDILVWLDELDMEPAHLRDFRDRLTELVGPDESVEEYTTAAVAFQEVENSLDEEGVETITHLAELPDDERERLTAVADATCELPGGIEEVVSALEAALDIQAEGFDLDTARAVAAELAAIEDDEEEALSTLAARYEEYGTLDAGIADLQEQRADLDEEIEDLRETREELQADRDRLQDSLDSQRDALEDLRATHESVQDNLEEARTSLERYRDERDTLERKLEDLERERDVVLAYRQFLRDGDLSDYLLWDLDQLLDPKYEPLRPEAEIREGIGDELQTAAHEMIEGDEVISVEEHQAELARVREECIDHFEDLYAELNRIANALNALQKQRDEDGESAATADGTETLENQHSTDAIVAAILDTIELEADEGVAQVLEGIRHGRATADVGPAVDLSNDEPTTH